MNAVIIEAIKNKKIIELDYENENRVVEVHCYGITRRATKQ